MANFDAQMEFSQTTILTFKLDSLASVFFMFPSVWYNMKLEQMLHEKRVETSKAIKEMNIKKDFVRKVCHVMFDVHSLELGTTNPNVVYLGIFGVDRVK